VSYPDSTDQPEIGSYGQPLRKSKGYVINIVLFVLTFITTVIAGMEWVGKIDLEDFAVGLPYAFAILFVLACHEFGHYFASRHHNVKATLPYFIPCPPIPFFLNFGTFGAVIRTKSPVPSRKAMFDIGVAGPIAGFVASLLLLVFGLTHLPPKEYLYTIHPEYLTGEKVQGIDLIFGDTLFYRFLAMILTNPRTDFVPPMNEIYHYPFLCVGWFGLFVTAMNMMPIGQLDGGHIIYAMFGRYHRIIARVSFGFLLLLGLLGFVPMVGMQTPIGWTGWLFWAAITLFVIKLDHPPIADPEPLDEKREFIGWVSLLLLLLSFSPSPFVIRGL
jgi:membrane-associated protease RseP (regulator of RpoE activity)